MKKLITKFALGLWGISSGNYSGITPIADQLYAIVDDKDQTDGFRFLSLEIDSISGKVTYARMSEPKDVTKRRNNGVITDRDCEGVCFYPEKNTVFISGEANQDILEYDLDGQPTGRELEVPECMSNTKIAFNLGFESLTYNDVQHLFWTTTESMLLADDMDIKNSETTFFSPLESISQTACPVANEKEGEYIAKVNSSFEISRSITINKQEASSQESNVGINTKIIIPKGENKVRLVSFDDNLKPVHSYIYRIDEPTRGNKKGSYVHGISSMLALNNGKLLILEREGFCPKWKLGTYVNHKIYVVDFSQEQEVPLDTPMREVTEEMIVKKTLLLEFKTQLTLFTRTLANYEGMCLGPKLSNGVQTLLLISDSQNGMGNWFFHLKDYIAVYQFKLDCGVLE